MEVARGNFKYHFPWSWAVFHRLKTLNHRLLNSVKIYQTLQAKQIYHDHINMTHPWQRSCNECNSLYFFLYLRNKHECCCWLLLCRVMISVSDASVVSRLMTSSDHLSWRVRGVGDNSARLIHLMIPSNHPSDH